MRKIVFIFLLIVFAVTFITPSFAETLQGEVTLNWPLLNQQERDKIINEYRDLLFKNLEYKVDSGEFSEYKKDKDWKQNNIYKSRCVGS